MGEWAFQGQHNIIHLFFLKMLQQLERNKRNEHWRRQEEGLEQDGDIVSVL